MTDSSTPPSATHTNAMSPAKTDDSGQSVRSMIITGANDFRLVFLYPLCTGVMTGVGFILGKRLGEKYFYGGVGKSP